MKYTVFTTSVNQNSDDATDDYEHMIILNNDVEFLADFYISVSEKSITECIASGAFSNLCRVMWWDMEVVWKVIKIIEVEREEVIINIMKKACVDLIFYINFT